jgi:berberine-like enzyme
LLAELSFPVSAAAAGRALDTLRGWRDLLSCAPRQATFTASIGSDAMVVIGFVWVGDPAQGRRLLPGLRALGRPAAERVLDLSYLELQRMSDSVQKHALRRYSKGHYLRELPDGALEAFLGRGAVADSDDFVPDDGFQPAGAYVNFVNDAGAEGVLRAYSPEKLARLTAVKTAYDPDNVFHLNHNIKPVRR